MSVVIVGGNERMERQYMDICKKFDCKAKIYTKPTCALQNIGRPDLLVLFTNTVSHKMVKVALDGAKSSGAVVTRSHSSSAAALKNILSQHAVKKEV
ncbi:MAG: DUF2325 domain-containing protein [Clostridia bacterium]|nr:DUF2325 domain-containing protein [Clostridia bacterium]